MFGCIDVWMHGYIDSKLLLLNNEWMNEKDWFLVECRVSCQLSTLVCCCFVGFKFRFWIFFFLLLSPRFEILARRRQDQDGRTDIHSLIVRVDNFKLQKSKKFWKYLILCKCICKHKTIVWFAQLLLHLDHILYKYNKKDDYIKGKLEPWFNGVHYRL